MNSSSSSLRGFRFYPTEEELVSFYLRNKLENRRKDIERVIPVLDVYNFEPWQLPQQSGEPCARDSEQWFFFCPMQVREAQGGRPNRTTPSGYWKATGSPILVYPVNGKARGPIGVKKTMVFYKGKTPHGTKTKWKMNEYKAVADIDQDNSIASTITTSSLRTCNDFSLCRVYVRTGCLRSFDRRPRVSTSTTPAGPQGNCPLPPAVEPCSLEKMTATASRESSSSSGDHGVDGDDADWIIPEGVDGDDADWIIPEGVDGDDADWIIPEGVDWDLLGTF